MGKRGPKPEDLKERLLRRRIIIGDCWIWTGWKNSKGYGMIGIGHRGLRFVHRISYELFNGPIDKPNVCHACDTPACFNPKHLFLGTQRDNLRDALEKGRCKNKVFYGEDHGSRKLTAEAVKEIRSTYSPRTISRVFLAKKFGVNRSCIDKVLSGETWEFLRNP